MAKILTGGSLLPVRRRALAVLLVALIGLVPVTARKAAAASGFTNPTWAQTAQWTDLLADGGAPVAESSPMVATLDGGGPSVVVGDRSGKVYAFHLSDGSAVSGWPASVGAPVDSTPSVKPIAGGLDDVYIGAGNAAQPVTGGYDAFGPGGNLLWHHGVQNPTQDAAPDSGVQASLSVGSLQPGATDVVAGSLGQEAYAIGTGSGATLPGWPFFDSDSTFSTAALADLYGTGQTEEVVGGDQTAGNANGQNYTQGGHLRILNGTGDLICHADTNQVIDSSPAVGGFLANGATGAVVGTGSYFAGASESDVVMAFNSDCAPQWIKAVSGNTFSSPALANILGTGALDVVEGVDQGSNGGSVYALNGINGATLWDVPVLGRVIGSVTTADLFGNGYQDVLVPTIQGVEILDGRTGAEVAELNSTAADGVLGFQNSPLVTTDADGDVGITLAGYNGNNQGVVEHFEVPSSDGAAVDESGSWPMFHHDPQLTGDAGRTPALGGGNRCQIPSEALPGYNLAAADGGVFSFGQTFCGSLGKIHLTAPIVGVADAPNTGGYWMVGADGGVFAFGGAGYYGSMGGKPLTKPIVGIAATPDGRGYWLVASDGGVFTFGDARFFGSTGNLTLKRPVVGIGPSADGGGYRLVASDGGIFAFGDAGFFGSAGNLSLTAPVIGMASDDATGGYWMVAADGGVFAYDAPFDGSMGGRPLAKPIVGVQAPGNGAGYRMVASDGGVFAFGAAAFDGSTGNIPLAQPIVGMAGG